MPRAQGCQPWAARGEVGGPTHLGRESLPTWCRDPPTHRGLGPPRERLFLASGPQLEGLGVASPPRAEPRLGTQGPPSPP